MIQSIPLFHCQNASFQRPGADPGRMVLQGINWKLEEGQIWAVVGPVASGKTSLCDALLGQLTLTAGSRDWPFLEQLRSSGRAVGWPSEAFRRVAFKEESHLFSYSRHYLQQRFNFIEPEDDLTLERFLTSGRPIADSSLHSLAATFGIERLLGQSMITLSNGQTRRARLAKALLELPELLILDEPFAGLDRDGVTDLANLLRQLVEKGQRLLLVTQSTELPVWITHVLEMDSGEVHWQGRRSDWQPRAIDLPARVQHAAPSSHREPVVELRQVQIQHGGKLLLEGIDWQVHRGERWGLVGPNGSGKSTLLSVIIGDHPQAYGNDISLFGKRRGSGESIWDLRKRIGYLSPELHFYFSEPLNAQEVVLTGLFDVMVYRSGSEAQRQQVQRILEVFGIAELALRAFRQLSTGQQRLILLARAIVKQPELVVLDEPFQALDAQQVQQARRWLDERLQPEQTLLFVSHRESDFPSCIDHRLELSGGRIVSRGDWARDSMV